MKSSPRARTLKAIAIDRRQPELLNVNRIIQVSTVHSAQISARRAERQIIPTPEPRNPTRPYNICTHDAYNGLKALPATRAIVQTVEDYEYTYTHDQVGNRPGKRIGKCHSKSRVNRVCRKCASLKCKFAAKQRNEENRSFKVNKIYLSRLYAVFLFRNRSINCTDSRVCIAPCFFRRHPG